MKKQMTTIILIALTILFSISLVLYYSMFRHWMNTWNTFILYHVFLGLSLGGMALMTFLSYGTGLNIVLRASLGIVFFLGGAALPIGLTSLADGQLFHYSHYHRCTVFVCSIELFLFATLLFLTLKNSLPQHSKITVPVYVLLLAVSAFGILCGSLGYRFAYPVYRAINGAGGYASADKNIRYAFSELSDFFSLTDSIKGSETPELTVAQGEECGFQLLVAADKTPGMVTLSVSDFTDGHGNVLSADVYTSVYETAHYRLDAMYQSDYFPVNITLSDDRAVEIAAGSNHAFYVTVKAPASAPFATYHADLTLRAADGTLLLEKELTATVSGSEVLQFATDGQFRILQFADLHSCPLSTTEQQLLKDAIERTEPNLIVLTGDNIFSTSGDMVTSIASYMDIFEAYHIPVAMVFGNHDTETLQLGKLQQFGIYNNYSCYVGQIGAVLGNRIGNYHLPILSSDGSKTAFNLWFIDSGMNNDENDLGGYGCVTKEQISWYVATSDSLTQANGGQKLPSLNFQHIIVPEVKEVLTQIDELNWALPAGNDGHMGPEGIGAPLYSNGQFDAFVTQGDVLATIAGHDHTNSFVVTNRGVDIVLSPICTFIGSNDESIGYRVFTLDEAKLWNYETYMDEYYELYKDDTEMLKQFEKLK